MAVMNVMSVAKRMRIANRVRNVKIMFACLAIALNARNVSTEVVNLSAKVLPVRSVLKVHVFLCVTAACVCSVMVQESAKQLVRMGRNVAVEDAMTKNVHSRVKNGMKRNAVAKYARVAVHVVKTDSVVLFVKREKAVLFWNYVWDGKTIALFAKNVLIAKY